MVRYVVGGIIIHDFSTLIIEHVIIHEVLRQRMSEDKEPPIFSEIESSLNHDSTKFLKDKIVNTIGSIKSYEVIFNPSTDSPIPEFVKELLLNEHITESFISSSKQIAEHLNNEQSGRNSGGFLLVLYGSNNGVKIIGILKLEKEEGAQLKQSVRNGRNTFEITNIKDLILSKNTKLFKIGVFYGLEDGIFEGKICDNQITSKGDIAHFFLQNFLGCSLKEDPAVQTKKFFESSIAFFKNNINDPLTQNRCKLHLQSYVSSQSDILNARTFAVTYLDTEYRSNYEQYLRTKGVLITNIIKDSRYIDSNIHKYLCEFENGIQIISKNKNLEENVLFEELDNGNTRATVESRLKHI